MSFRTEKKFIIHQSNFFHFYKPILSLLPTSIDYVEMMSIMTKSKVWGRLKRLSELKINFTHPKPARMAQSGVGLGASGNDAEEGGNRDLEEHAVARGKLEQGG